MKIYKSFTRDVGIIGLSEILLRFRPLIFLPIFTKILGTSDYGIYTTLFVTIGFLGPMATMGLEGSILRFLPAVKEKKSVSSGLFSSLWLSFINALVIALFIFAFADTLAATVFGDPGSTEVIRAGSLLLPLAALLKILFTYFRMKRRMVAFSALRLLKDFGPAALASFFLLTGHGLREVIYSFIAVQAALVLITLIVLVHELGFSLPDKSTLGPYLAFGFPLILASLSTTILNVGDRYVIGFMMTSAAVGIYAVAYNIGNLVVVLLRPISSSLLSPLSKSYDEGRKNETRNYINYSIRYFLMIAIPATVGLSVIAAPLTKSLTTAEFALGAMGVTAIIAVSNIAYGLFLLSANVLYLIKKSLWTAIMLAVAAIANIILNIFLVPVMGLEGAAISTMASFIALFITAFLLASRHVRLSLDWLFIAKSILAALAMGLVVYYIAPRGWVSILLTSLLGVAIYFGLLFLMKAFGEKELKFFTSFLKRSAPDEL